MRTTRLGIVYRVTQYEDGLIQPGSARTFHEELSYVFAHVEAIGELLKLVDASKVFEGQAENHAQMLACLGELCSGLGEAGTHSLLALNEWEDERKPN